MPFDFSDAIPQESPDSQHIEAIRTKLSRFTKPVRPLPPDRVLVSISVAAFVALAFLLNALTSGWAGFHAKSAGERTFEYAVLILSACLLAVSLIPQMIPGARQRVPTALAIAFPFAAMSLSSTLLFPHFGLEHFVHQGIPCLVLGTACAIPSAVLAWIWLRWGYVTEPIPAAITGGALSGLVGVAVLAFHCPIRNAAHIMVWHLAAIAIASAAGALVGWLATRLATARE